MKWPAVVAIAVSSALGGAGLSGWIVSTKDQAAGSPGLMATNTGYLGPAGVAEGPMPGGGPIPGTGIANPYGHSAAAVAEGHRLFMAMNCASCHGYKGVGGMGPELDDNYWRYGGTPVEIYKSIYEGRPKGMPAWGVALPPSQIWALTSYIQSLGGGVGAGNAPGTNAGPVVHEASKSAAGQEGQ